VKFLILDGDSPPEPAPASSIAMIRLAMPSGVTADLFVDNKKVATVSDQQEIPVSAGQRTVKLVGPSGTRCEQNMTLAAGKTTTLECAMVAAPAAGSDGSAAGSDAAGSAAAGSAGPTPGSNDGKSASATPPVADHPVPDKTDKMPVEEPAKTASKPSDKPADPTAGKVVEHADKSADKAIDKAASKPPDKPVDKAAEKAPEKTADKTADKPADKPADKSAVKTDKPADKSAKPAVDDDPLGKLQGGTKPGDKHAVRTDAKGYLNVSNTTAARILIDGEDTGLTTPITGHMLPLTPGVHRITFMIRTDKVTFSVTIAPGETFTLQKDLR
jgi:hypothetical protein